MTMTLERPRSVSTTPAQRLQTTMAAVRLTLRWFGVRKTLTPQQKTQAAESFGAEGEFLSARKKLLDTRHPVYKEVTAVRGRVTALWKGMAPLVEEARFQEMNRKIERRGRTQRGVPRSKDPARYPLSCRIVDLTDGCGAMMHGQRPIYVCGRYMRTEGDECENNAVDGEALLRFTLKTLRQLVDRHGNRDKLRQLLRERAQQRPQDAVPSPTEQELRVARVKELTDQLAVVRRRMALETNEHRYAAIAEEFDRMRDELRSAEKELEAQQRSCLSPETRTPEAEVDAAMALLDDIGRIATDEKARSGIHPVLQKLGLWIGLNFGSAIKGKKRVVRRLLGGRLNYLTLREGGGNRPSVASRPVAVRSGPHDRP